MKEIKKLFTQELSKFGFRYKKDWYFKNDDLIIVINLQKSNYSKLYFLNVGIWFNQISTEFEFPKEYKCHIRFRAEDLFPSVPDELHSLFLLDLEENFNDRLGNIKIFLTDYLGPSLENFKSVKSNCKMYKEGKLSFALIKKEVKEICRY